MTRYLVHSDFGIDSYVDDKPAAERVLIEDFGCAYNYYSADEVSTISVLTDQSQTVYCGDEEICNFITKGGIPGIECIYVFNYKENITELFNIVEVTD